MQLFSRALFCRILKMRSAIYTFFISPARIARAESYHKSAIPRAAGPEPTLGANVRVDRPSGVEREADLALGPSSGPARVALFGWAAERTRGPEVWTGSAGTRRVSHI